MKNVIIGTAGHVDHGKTTLIKALTGYDTDRLKEEKKRGITIELGFANMENDKGYHIGIIDVPGHEKFVKNMLAGIGGIDLVLFIIALDEGVMQQTVEHFEIIKKLDIKNGIIVYTKKDLAENNIQIVNSDVDKLVKNSFLENAKRIAVSSINNDGIDELKNMIFETIKEIGDRREEKEFMRMPIDRVFTMEGFGTVVTGTLIEGVLGIEDKVAIYPKDIDVKIRNIQSHSQNEKEAYAGQRVAVNLSNIKKEDIERGDVLCLKNSILVSRVIDAYVEMFDNVNRKIKNGDRVHFNYGSRQTEGKIFLLDKDEIEKSDKAYCQLRFDTNICVKKNDKFILRFFSPVESIAGGVVIDPMSWKHKRKDEKVLHHLKMMKDGDLGTQILEVVNSFFDIYSTSDICLRLHLTKKDFSNEVGKLLNENKIVKVSNEKYISVDFFNNIYEYAKNVLVEFHKNNPILLGMNKEEFKNKIIQKFKITDNEKIEALVEALVENKKIIFSNGVIKNIGFAGGINEKTMTVADEIEKEYKNKGVEVDKVDLMLEKYKDKKIARQIVNDLSKNHILVKVDNDIYIHKEVFNSVLEKIYKFYEKNEKMTLADLRDILNTSRKYALFILDTCDRLKITKRVEDYRILLKKMVL